MRRVVPELKIQKAISIPSLRPSSATPWLEAGVHLRLIPPYLGPSALNTTMVALPWTTARPEPAVARIETLRGPGVMPSVADVWRRYGGEYLEPLGATRPAAHQKVLRAITACRTGGLGTVLYACPSCGRTHPVGRSCGNRQGPSCQQEKTQAWLENQLDRLRPCPDFLVTFTRPAERRAWARRHPRVVDAARFEASSAARRAWAADPKFVGTDRLGFFGVWHTGGRTLDSHPPVHSVVPGGGLRADGSCGLPSRADFLVPVEALSMVFRAQFRDLLPRAGLRDLADPAVWRRDWVVHSQAAGDGRASWRSLAP
jgi:hypothetical protein